MYQNSDHSSITSRLARLIAALLEHLLALSSLAAWEGKEGLKQAFVYLLLTLLALLLGFIGYLLLIAIFLVVAVSLYHFSLLPILIALAGMHFLLVGGLGFFLYQKSHISFFELTRLELLKDIHALKRD